MAGSNVVAATPMAASIGTVDKRFLPNLPIAVFD
jgi:hypothetical protein